MKPSSINVTEGMTLFSRASVFWLGHDRIGPSCTKRVVLELIIMGLFIVFNKLNGLIFASLIRCCDRLYHMPYVPFAICGKFRYWG